MATIFRTITLALGMSLVFTANTFVQAAGPQQSSSSSATTQRALVDKYCIGCHNQRSNVAGLHLDILDLERVDANGEILEKWRTTVDLNP